MRWILLTLSLVLWGAVINVRSDEALEGGGGELSPYQPQQQQKQQQQQQHEDHDDEITIKIILLQTQFPAHGIL